MPQEPWKRASQLQRAVPREARGAPAPPPLRPPKKPWWVLWVLIPVALLAGWFYLNSLQTLWLRLRRQESTSHTSTAVHRSEVSKTNKVALTGDVIDQGLGIGLVVYSDYHTLLDKTKDRGIEWSFTGEGNSLRLSAPGVTVYVDGKNITAYTLKFDEVFAEEHWSWWCKKLADAGFKEDSTSLQLTGQSAPQGRVSLYGTRSIHQNQGWATPAFELSFFQDRLDELHAGIRPGPGPDQPTTR
jgi:hypothetical protein